jgi:hypothetical protein
LLPLLVLGLLGDVTGEDMRNTEITKMERKTEKRENPPQIAGLLRRGSLKGPNPQQITTPYMGASD